MFHSMYSSLKHCDFGPHTHFKLFRLTIYYIHTEIFNL